MARGRRIFPWGGPGGAFIPQPKATPVTIPTVTGVTPSSDRYPVGGASVTITGTNFALNSDGSEPLVLFGANPATSVVVVSSTEITCDTPSQPSPGQYNISVTVNGQTGTLVAAFTYISSYLVSISPNFSPLPGGAQAVVKGLNLVTGSTIKIGSTVVTSTFVDSQTYFIVIPAGSLGYENVSLTDPFGVTTTLANGFQYTLLNRGSDIRRSQPQAIQINYTLGQPGSATFCIDGQSNKPQVGEKILLEDALDSNRILFAGTITNVQQDYEEQGQQLVWTCTAIDFTFLLNKYRPFGRFTLISASEVVQTLVAQYAPLFTTAHVQSNLAPVSMYFDGTQDLATCLTQIAQQIGGGHWYVDDTMDVHFFHIQAPGLDSLPGVVPGGIQVTINPGIGLLQNMEAVGTPLTATMVLVN